MQHWSYLGCPLGKFFNTIFFIAISILKRFKFSRNCLLLFFTDNSNFIEWYDLQQISRTVPFTTRDLVAWMTFIKDSAGNTGFSKNCCSIIHGICLVIIDGLATVLRGEALTNFVLEVKQLFEKNYTIFLLMKEVTMY
mgnify:CR=1 FL=1